MRKGKVIDGGIFIDYQCSRVERLENGIFLSTSYRNSDTDKEFEADLKSFLDKWYPTTEYQSITCYGGQVAEQTQETSSGNLA